MVYGVKTSLIPKLKKSSGNWINVLDFARIKVPYFMSIFNTAQHTYNVQALRDMDSELDNYLNIFRKVKDSINSDSEVHNVFKKRNSLKLSSIYYDKCNTLRSAYFHLFGRTHEEEAIANGVVDYAKNITKRYKLINSLGRWHLDSCMEHVALYIDAIDNKEKV